MADFQQVYGIPLPLEGEPDDLPRAAALWSQLPADSRCAKLQAPELGWTSGDYLLWHIEFQLRNLTWALQYDKKRPQPKPQPLPTPGRLAEAHRKADAAMAAKEELDRLLGMEG